MLQLAHAAVEQAGWLNYLGPVLIYVFWKPMDRWCNIFQRSVGGVGKSGPWSKWKAGPGGFG